MSRIYIQKILLIIILEALGVVSAFLIAYSLRSMRDWIPFIQLPIPYISIDQYIPYIVSGLIIWLLVNLRGGLYSIKTYTPIIEEIRLILTYSFFWFFIYIGFVYLSTGFIFSQDIPRLIILYTYLIATILSILIRYTVYTIYSILYDKGKIKKDDIVVISTTNEEKKEFNKNSNTNYIYYDLKDISKIETLIKNYKIAGIIFLGEQQKIESIFTLARIYGIPLMYPKISKYTPINNVYETWIEETPMIELRSVSITAWGRIGKRVFDLLISITLSVILIPVFLIISIGIFISDPSGPIIYKNRRIGQYGKVFALYKFRYMYWKYCTKEEYGINDEALKYEEELKKEFNTREGPLYKIANDPRKMPWGKIIEKLSLDELPQLFNVIMGDMSLIGPRPHQPREIDKYNESDKQVLTIKPGITGMAQVYGRDKNSFENEIQLDTYYIEHYSTSLDIAILLRTFLVVFLRFFRN